MSKKEFLVILILSVAVTWLGKETSGILNFSLGGLNAGWPLAYYQCAFISSCNINYTYLALNIIFWFMVIWISRKVLGKITVKK
ncbi:hypothetical protein KKE78_05760 [Patescibacteria group bacterium]|nr:hypothetical protein [Patescibacteria group bacterium]